MALAAVPARAAKNYGPGVTDTEIKIGNTAPYSGPASSYSMAFKALTAYYAMVNAEGGINGRKINFISLDEASCWIWAHSAARAIPRSGII
jgi:ABC-type branched-subunit amino acid transport system substrate-binding protein